MGVNWAKLLHEPANGWTFRFNTFLSAQYTSHKSNLSTQFRKQQTNKNNKLLNQFFFCLGSVAVFAIEFDLQVNELS